MVLTEDDFVRLQRQKGTQLASTLPLRSRASVLEFIHKSVFEHCLAQRLLESLDQEEEGMTEEAMEAMLTWINAASPEALMMLRAGIEASEAARSAGSAEATARQQGTKAKVLDWISTVLNDRGLSADAMAYVYKALAIQEKVFGTDHVNTSRSYNNIGALLRDQSKHDQAREYYLKALAIRAKVLGTDHADTVASYSNIALLLKAQGKPAQALEYYRKALAYAVAHNHPDAAKYQRRIDSPSKKAPRSWALRFPCRPSTPAGSSLDAWLITLQHNSKPAPSMQASCHDDLVSVLSSQHHPSHDPTPSPHPLTPPAPPPAPPPPPYPY
jgi:tetratricopeptide (TPR) repeat protein